MHAGTGRGEMGEGMRGYGAALKTHEHFSESGAREALTHTQHTNLRLKAKVHHATKFSEFVFFF